MSFVEYDQRAHRLNTLATFSFWVSNGYANFQGSNPNSPMFNLNAPPKLRIPSSSRGNPSEYEDVPSPIVDYSGENLAVPPQSSGSMSKVDTSMPPPETKKVDVTCQRPGEDLSAQEDGPVFRATMRALEMKTGAMRQRMKKVLRRAQDAHQAQMACNNAMSDLIESIRDASTSNANAVQPAMDHYFDKIAKEILSYEKRNTRNIQTSIIDPLSKVYEQDIKKAEMKKKEFEDESRDYYQYLGRYLGQKNDAKERKKEESDAKYQSKRKTFELKRFDYGCFMQDLHGGRKEQEVLSWLTKYADNQTKTYLNTAERVKQLLPELEALSTEVEEADKAFSFTRTEREEKRRTIELSTAAYQAPESIPRQATANGQTSYISDSDLLARTASTRNGSLAPTRTRTEGGRTPNSEGTPVISPREPGSNKFQGIRDLEDPDHGSANGGIERKEGLLFALSKPGSHVDPKGLNKTAWHKFWIVLDQGKLSEYSNWKDKLDLHAEPIDLRLATVREARGQERRFCFEVVTPSFTRVYQGQSEEDARSWMRAVSNALQSAMEGRGATQGLPSRTGSGNKHGETSPGLVRGVGRDIGSILTGKSSSSQSHNNGTSTQGNSQSKNNDIFRRTTVGSRPSYGGGRRESNHTSSEHSSDQGGQADGLLQELRLKEEGNKWCADCGSGVKTEWVSINLGVVLCIECSGIHRSLGTHVSKVRSLTLDFRGFTNDIVALLRMVGNTVSNSVYEATLPTQNSTEAGLQGMNKPAPNATRDQRLHFITKKYVDRLWVSPLHPTLSPFATPDDLLLASIKKQDVKGVLHALALRANPNACDKSRGTHAVFLALAAADPGAPSGVMSLRPITAGGSTSRSVSTGSVAQAGVEKMAFPIAEALVLNGAEVPAIGPGFPLGAGAQAWLEAKRSRESAQKLEHTASAAGTTSSYTGGMGSGNMGQGGMAGIAGGQTERERREAKLQKRVSAGGRLVGLGRSN